MVSGLRSTREPLVHTILPLIFSNHEHLGFYVNLFFDEIGRFNGIVKCHWFTTSENAST